MYPVDGVLAVLNAKLWHVLLVLLALNIAFLIWRGAIRPRIPGPGRRALAEGAGVIVTGCDCGFGKRIALDLHAKGATVFAGCISEESATKLRAEAASAVAAASGSGGRAESKGPDRRMRTLILDVSKDEDVAAAVAAVKESKVPLYALVNNAGISAFGFAEGVPVATTQKNAEVNFLGTVRMTKAFLPLLRRSSASGSADGAFYGPGRIVNMGSIGTRMPSAFGSAYLPTKAAMVSYGDCVRQEVHRFGVKVCLVEPGFFATSLLENASQRGAVVAASTAGTTPQGYPDFATKMAKMSEPILLFEKLNGDIGVVTGRVLDAIETRFPLPRYTVGYDALLIRHLLCHAPAWLVDTVQTLLG